MALINSQHIALKTKAYPFSLMSVDDKIYTLADFKDYCGLLIAFICNHCPYVKAIEDRLIALAQYAKKRDVATVAICANDPIAYPEDNKANLYQRSIDKNYGFPYLIDEDQSVAKNYGALCTPDLFLYDEHQELFYHGRFDDNRDISKVKQQDLLHALEDMLDGKNPPLPQYPSMGCSIKWRL